MAENIIELMKKDKFASYVGVEIIWAKEGKAEARLRTEEKHLNGLGIVQGGAIFTLADTTFAAASNSREGTAVAVNVGITYCQAAKSGVLIAKAREVSLKRKLATYVVEVFSAGEEGEPQELIALFQGTVYRKT
ncbi:MAG: PaaI family thioesterase [Desulfitobacteriia bacterium]|jgi:acyl-CoA thioesterase